MSKLIEPSEQDHQRMQALIQMVHMTRPDHIAYLNSMIVSARLEERVLCDIEYAEEEARLKYERELKKP